MDIAFLIPVMIVLLLAKGFFSGTEIALVSSNKLKLRGDAERGNQGAALVLKLYEKPESLLATTLIGTNIATMTLTVLGTVTMIGVFGHGGDFYATLLLTPLMLIFGEIVPKSVFQQRADTIAPIAVKPLAVFRTLVLPIAWGFGRIGSQLAKRFGPEGVAVSPYITRQRLRLMLQTTTEETADIKVFDRDRIRRAIRLSDMTVGEAMIPMAQVTGAPNSATMADLLTLSHHIGHRRIPLYEGNIGNIIAIASWSIWDEAGEQFSTADTGSVTVAPHFASTIQRLDDLLPVLLARPDHMVVAVDEFGTAAGIVTIDDLMFILLGDVARGAHLGPQVYKSLAQIEICENDVLLLDARTRLAELAELLDVELPTREFHTVGGLLTSRLRRIPTIGDSLEEGGYQFTVVDSTERAPTRIRVQPA